MPPIEGLVQPLRSAAIVLPRREALIECAKQVLVLECHGEVVCIMSRLFVCFYVGSFEL